MEAAAKQNTSESTYGGFNSKSDGGRLPYMSKEMVEEIWAANRRYEQLGAEWENHIRKGNREAAKRIGKQRNNIERTMREKYQLIL